MADKRICAINGCNKQRYARGWCQRHYARWRVHGDPAGGQQTVRGARLSFAQQAVHYLGDECLVWPYSLVKGYGEVSVSNQKFYAHRFVCAAAHGPAPSPCHEAAHSCGESRCINPRHLRWATRQQNEDDKLIHGTRNFGERNGGAKLSASEVREIIALRGKASQSQLAAMFGISRAQISRIHTGKKWASLDTE